MISGISMCANFGLRTKRIEGRKVRIRQTASKTSRTEIEGLGLSVEGAKFGLMLFNGSENRT